MFAMHNTSRVPQDIEENARLDQLQPFIIKVAESTEILLALATRGCAQPDQASHSHRPRSCEEKDPPDASARFCLHRRFDDLPVLPM